MAGYVAINAAALCTAIEFGSSRSSTATRRARRSTRRIRSAVAVPAMMLGHLTVAGLAEAFASAGVVAFVQRTEPGLLAAAAGALPEAAVGAPARRGLARFWLALGVLLALTPLGILAGGDGLGRVGRRRLRAPGRSPGDRRRLARPRAARRRPRRGWPGSPSLWTAPFADYAPSWVSSPVVGYVLSAMFGTGVVILLAAGVGWIARRRAGGAAGTVTT